MPNTAASRMVLGSYSEELVTSAARETLRAAGGRVSCAFVFASSDYRPHLADFLELIQVHGHAPIIAGSSGSGLLGTATEAERAAGFSLLFLNLPETELFPCHFTEAQAQDASTPADWRKLAGTDSVDAWIVLADPSAIAIEPWIEEWNETFPGIPCIGGLGSGGAGGDDIFVFHDRQLIEGGVAIGFRGGLRVRAIISQGCRPIGEPLTITGADQNIVTSLASRPAYEALTEAFEALPETAKPRARGNLFAGLAMSEYVDEYKTGDFLVRNILGADAQNGAVALGAWPRVGQTLQFQLRDRESAAAELRALLAAADQSKNRPFASLVFSCTGRGKNLFGGPNHDAGAIAAQFGPIPSAGFFCNGEIGPVGPRNFIHGYTASIALLCDPD
jgi:small ligand-binding sensory domain FIST